MNPLDSNIDALSDDESDKLFKSKSLKCRVSNIFYSNLGNIKTKLNCMIDKNSLYKHFNTPYIVCLKDDANYQKYFNDEIISSEELNILKDSIRIVPIKYNILSESMYIYLTTISCQLFNSFNIKNIKGEIILSDNDVLLCCLLRFKYCDIIRYLKQYNGISEFIDIYNGLFIGEYLGQNSSKSIIKQNQIRMINNMAESNYWTIYNNCKLNYTTKFKLNSFNLSINERLTDKKIENVIKHLSTADDDNNYLEFLFIKSNYVDASSSINLNGYKLYTITPNILIDIEQFNIMINKLSEDVQYYLIMNCLISKDLCHLIINNKYILNKINASNKFKDNSSFMQLYGQLFRYYLGYAWITMYMEESIKRSFIKSTDRFIFDIDTASLLPWYPYTVQNIHVCPYIPILVAHDILIPSTNILGIEQHIYTNTTVNEITRYGVCSKDIFIKRINQFISGKNDINILSNIDWSNLGMSGSIMAACLPNYNTLMSKFIKNKHTFDIDFVGFIKEYYLDADIDIMCNIKDLYKFVDKIIEFNSTLKKNIKQIYSLDTTDDIDITKIFTNKSASILINKHFINKYIITVLQLSYIEIISDLNIILIKEIVYKHYIEWHKEYLKQSATNNPDQFFNPIYHEIFIPVPIDQINIILINPIKSDSQKYTKPISKNTIDKLSDIDSDIESDIEEQILEFVTEPIGEPIVKPIIESVDSSIDESDNIFFLPKINYKFRISSYYLPHNFEFFQIKYDDFFSTVSQFHLPIVRSYFDGNNIYLTPSCISACMTFLNIDYKYFAGRKDPIEIINKYRMRGFGTILNKKEITKLIEYSTMVPKWKKLYKLNIYSNSAVMNMVGILNINNLFFRPSMILKNAVQDQYEKLIIDVDYTVIPTNLTNLLQLIRQIYKISNKINYDMITINKFGYINPVKKWFIDAFNDIDISRSLDLIN